MNDKWRLLAGIIAIGSIWGMLECILGSIKLSGPLADFPMGALLGGFVGIGLMVLTRRYFGVPGMQFAMAAVAGALRAWAPVGTCVVCSALAIVAEGLVFEIKYKAKIFSPYEGRHGSPAAALGLAALIPLGIVSGYTVYVSGYMFTQIFTPIFTTGVFTPSDFMSVLPLILGRGLFAAVFGAVAVPLAVLVPLPKFDIYKVGAKPYLGSAVVMTIVCWAVVLALFLPRLL
jgi:hypothetical protein